MTTLVSQLGFSGPPRGPSCRPPNALGDRGRTLMGAGRGAATPEDRYDPPQAHQRPRPFQQDEPKLPVYDRYDGQHRGAQEVRDLVGEFRRINEAELAGGVGPQYRQRS